MLFLHDLTRLGDADYDAGDARDRGATAGRAGRRAGACSTSSTSSTCSARRRCDDGAGRSRRCTGEGLDALRARLLELAGWQAAPEGLFIARARHVARAAARARSTSSSRRAHGERGNAALELFAEELRLAHDALGEITGAFTSDDLLGAIFGRFCIGK